MKTLLPKLGLAMAFAMSLPLTQTFAQESVELLPNDLMNIKSEGMTEPGKFKKDGPYRIGVSFPGVGNTWIVQMHQEAEFEAANNPQVKEFIFSEANWQPAKQVADIEDLMTRDLDALVVTPIAFQLVKKQIDAALATGIPVITFGNSKGALESTVEIMGAGDYFGEVGGTFLKEKLGGKGTIWAFRGVAGVEEESQRYEGFRRAIEGTDIVIGAEVYGDWNYAKSKQLCENLVLSGQPVDGIWFSGAEMTRACIDVFQSVGKPLVPMTGEGNNGFLKTWKESGVDAVSPVFTPGLGVAVVRAAVALLEGKSLHKTYFSAPEPMTNEDIDTYFRPDLNDAFWVPSTLPEEELQKLFKR